MVIYPPIAILLTLCLPEHNSTEILKDDITSTVMSRQQQKGLKVLATCGFPTSFLIYPIYQLHPGPFLSMVFPSIRISPGDVRKSSSSVGSNSPLVNICELDCSQWPLGGSSQLVRSWQLWLVSPLPGVIPLPNGLNRL